MAGCVRAPLPIVSVVSVGIAFSAVLKNAMTVTYWTEMAVHPIARLHLVGAVMAFLVIAQDVSVGMASGAVVRHVMMLMESMVTAAVQLVKLRIRGLALVFPQHVSSAEMESRKG